MLPMVWLLQTFIIQSYLCVDLTYHVKEGRSPKTYLGDIAADSRLLDSFPPHDHSLITFSLLDEIVIGNSQLFNVSKTGKFYTAQILDAESLCRYNTECFKLVEIAVQHKQSFIKILEVKVMIEDINDNEPEFSVKEINIKISETDGRGTTRFIPNAIDRDVKIQNSQIKYELKKNKEEPFSLFILERVEGSAELEIILEEKLDREVKDTYILQVIAKDGGFPPRQGTLKVIISVIDVNDNPPVFSQYIYNVSIKNTHHIVKAIAVLYATDLDSGNNGRISYSFSSKTSEQARKYFELNKETGEIFLLKDFLLGQKKTYKLFVEASDRAIPPKISTAIVLVNITNQQNNAPTIDIKFVSKSTENTAAISEDIEVGSFIAYVKVTDNDIGQNGEVICNLHHDKLQLQSLNKKKYKLVVKSVVDREIETNFNFVIICKDKGSPSLLTEKKLSIQIMDVNDVQPQFNKDTFRFLTNENEDSNFPVGLINATDPDLGPGGQLIYTLLNKHTLPFEISIFGFISTTHSLDREQQEIYKFQVIVKDNGTPSLNNTANVIVEVMDKNDNAPYFTFPNVNPFSLDVHYHPQSKTDITVLRASDRDSHMNAFIRYEILGGNDKQFFKIDPYTGVLSFSRPVYQNDAGSYDLQFVVKDSGTPVLSATTTLSLTLTVSNRTSKMFTALDTKKSDNKIHFNLVIIIVIAAVIVSVAIVVSIAICIVQRQNQRNVYYSSGVDVSQKCADQNIKYLFEPSSFQPSIETTTGRNLTRSEPSKLIDKPDSKYDLDQNWDGSEIHLQTVTEGNHQIIVPETAMLSGVEEEHMFIASDHFSEMSSQQDSGHGWSERDTVHYEELPDHYSCRPDQPQNTEAVNLPQTLISPMDTKAVDKNSYQRNADQNNPCSDIIDLNSVIVSSANSIPSQPWNLPIRSSFASYTKPLPQVPIITKISYT